MRNSIIIIFIAILLSGCSIFSKVNKNKEKTSSSETLAKDSAVDVSETIRDKSQTVIKEKAKEVVSTPEVGISKNTAMELSDLYNGAVIIDTGMVFIKQTYDTLSKKMNTAIIIKPQKIEVDIERETTIQNDITTDKNTKSTSSEQRSKEQKAILNNKIKEPDYSWLLYLIPIVVIVLFLLVYLNKRKA